MAQPEREREESGGGGRGAEKKTNTETETQKRQRVREHMRVILILVVDCISSPHLFSPRHISSLLLSSPSRHPLYDRIIQMRGFDEQAKIPDLPVPALAAYKEVMVAHVAENLDRQ